MESEASSDHAISRRSSVRRFSFEHPQNDDHYPNSNSNHSDYDCGPYLKPISGESSECHSVGSPCSDSENLFPPDDIRIGNNISDFLTTSIGNPEFDPELFQDELSSQNLFGNDEYDVQSVHSEEIDECEIVQYVGRPNHSRNNLSQEQGSVNLPPVYNGSTSNPILVDDTSTANDSSRPDDQFTSPVEIAVDNHTDVHNSNINLSETHEQDNDDVIMGAIHWSNKRPPQFPIDYYRHTRNISNTYKFIDESNPGINSIEDIEFLFKCPICYSTISRLRSGKVPTESDKVIYSTKCGHLFCYECIEKVKSRRECSICRKRLTDRNPVHVIYP